VSVWLTAREAAEHVRCKSVKAFYEWRRRHFIVPRSNGTYARADLDRALKAKRKKHRVSPASLANLRKRHERQSIDPSSSSGSPFIRQETV
jgi:hypothetical protein